LDAQFLVDRGVANNSGLTSMKISESATGTRDHQPIQSRLQTEAASSGTTAKRVQTLIGLACRIQFSPSSPKNRATLRSLVSLVCCDDGVDVLIPRPPGFGKFLAAASRQ
jgi:hypothetical protein